MRMRMIACSGPTDPDCYINPSSLLQLHTDRIIRVSWLCTEYSNCGKRAGGFRVESRIIIMESETGGE